MHNMSKMGLVLIGCTLIGCLAVGCGTVKKIWGKTGEQIIIAPSLPEGPSLSTMQFDDIPIPLNFKHQPKESTVYIHGNLRTANISYLGSARVEDVMDFYIKQMPQQQWIFKTSLAMGAKKKLLFEKGSERCEITIENKGGNSYLTVAINHKQ